MGFTISFAGAKDFTPYEGGGELYPFEGLTCGVIEKIETGVSKGGNQMFVFTLASTEAEAKGMKAKKWVPVTGNRSDGKPNVYGLLEGITSIYSHTAKSSDEAIAKARSLDTQNLDSDALIKELTGKPIYYEVRARPFDKDDGTRLWSSSVENFVVKQRYEDAKATNTHHRPLPVEVNQRTAPAGGGSASSGQPQHTASANGASSQPQQSAAPKSALGIL